MRSGERACLVASVTTIILLICTVICAFACSYDRYGDFSILTFVIWLAAGGLSAAVLYVTIDAIGTIAMYAELSYTKIEQIQKELHAIDEAKTSDAQSAKQPPVYKPSVEIQNGTWKCPSCGWKNKAADPFCSGCGKYR